MIRMGRLTAALLVAGAIGGAGAAAGVGLDDATPHARGADDPVARAAGADDGGSRSARADRRVRRAGTCTGRSRSKLSVKTEDGGRLEIEFEVDQNRARQRWGVVITRNGRAVLRRSFVTRPPSGSFTARRVIRDARGRDRLVARARNPRTGERCSARVVF